MNENIPISIHIVSDSLGETGEMVARAAVGQFAPGSFRIERLPKIKSPQQLRHEVKSHCGHYCLFLYTLVDQALCDEMNKLCDEGVNGVDLLSPAVDLLKNVTGYQPSGEVGAIRRTDEDYFNRIEAMEFAVSHDDGRHPEGYKEADVVLIGVSRTSKTPLSMYMAFKGIRVANYPFTPGVEPPKELFEVDPRKVFGLVTDPEVLLEIRRDRMRELGTWVPGYADREAVELELEQARALMRRIGCLVVHTDNRAVEEAAQEILRHLNEMVRTTD